MIDSSDRETPVANLNRQSYFVYEPFYTYKIHCLSEEIGNKFITVVYYNRK